MKLIEKADDGRTGLENRLESEDGRIEMGVYPVMYGARIRAGYTGQPCCILDWCMGSELAILTIFYRMLQDYFETFDTGEDPFKGLPTCSKVKPCWNDDEFMECIMGIINQRLDNNGKVEN